MAERVDWSAHYSDVTDLSAWALWAFDGHIVAVTTSIVVPTDNILVICQAGTHLPECILTDANLRQTAI